MKIILILLSLSFCQTNRNCSLKSFFPSELNCSKYEVIKVVGLKDNYKKISEREEYFDFEYLIEQNLKVKHSTLTFEKVNNNCIESKNNRTQFSFADDKLYKISVHYDLNGTYKQAYEKYIDIIDSLRKEVDFLYEVVLKISNLNDEQIGEGFTFSNSKEREDKLMEMQIQFKMQKNVWGEDLLDPYGISLNWVDLRLTKLDRRGY